MAVVVGKFKGVSAVSQLLDEMLMQPESDTLFVNQVSIGEKALLIDPVQ